jgi:integrase
MARIFRRGRTYWGRAQRRNRELRRSLKTTDRATAERRFRAWLDELDATAWGEKPKRTYSEAEDRFIREHLTTIKPRSAIRYGVSLKHLSEHFGHMTIDQIGSAELSSFESRRRGDGVTASTIRRDLACLSSLLTSCVDWEYTESNPVPAYLRRRSKRGLKEGAPRTRYLTEREELAVLAVVTPESREAIILAIDTGLRRDELFSLKWWQIDLDRGLIATTTNTKNGRSRMVPLPARSREVLDAIRQRQDNHHDDSFYVLVNPDTGTRYDRMNKGLSGAVGRTGIAHVQWHDLRRTAGCRWLQRDGKRIEEVSILLGHSSVQVTEQRYAFLEAERIAASLSGRTHVGTEPIQASEKPA